MPNTRKATGGELLSGVKVQEKYSFTPRRKGRQGRKEQLLCFLSAFAPWRLGVRCFRSSWDSPTASQGAGNFVARQRGVTMAQVEKEFFEKVRPSSLLKRFEKPEEFAAVVTFVASNQGAVINGAALRAEGGVVRSAL